jgi:hypothetical protein
MAKAGRPAKYVKDQRGRDIIGLSAQTYKGTKLRYYATFSRPRVWFGVAKKNDRTELSRIVREFAVWLKSQGKTIEYGRKRKSSLTTDFDPMKEIPPDFLND